MCHESHSTKLTPATRLHGRRRSALTLVEILVVVTLSSIILGVVVSLLVGLRQWDRRIRDHNVRSEQLARLAETMRDDIRQGTDVSLPTKESLLITSSGKSQTRYEVCPEGCRRSVDIPGESRQFIDLFSVGPAASWAFEEGLPGRRRLIVVTLERFARADDPDSRLAPLLVYAALGADRPMPTAPIVDE